MVFYNSYLQSKYISAYLAYKLNLVRIGFNYHIGKPQFLRHSDIQVL